MSVEQVRVPLTKDQAYALADAVMDQDALALTASAHEDEDTAAWYFEATCDGHPDIEAFNALAQHVLGASVEFAVEEIDSDTDWVSRSLEGLAPVEAGGFYVYGSHETGTPPPGLTPILIDAAQAFGTGHHETTTGCLEAIDLTLKHHRPRFVLDVGTGTGVLAIAIAKRLRTPVIASDIDPVAVDTTRDNAALNEVSKLVVPLRATGLDHRTIAGNAPYDLIVANILAGPLAELASSIGHVAQRGCTIILSGILKHQAPRVTDAYQHQNMSLRNTLQRGNWTTLILEKV